MKQEDLQEELDSLKTKRSRLMTEVLDCETEMIGIRLELDRRKEKFERDLESERGKERFELFDD